MPKPKETICQYCRQTFMSEAYETFTETDYDTMHAGWEYHTSCPQCNDRQGTDRRFKIECNYKSGYLTNEEYKQQMKGLK